MKVLITGSTSGIGKALALDLTKQGHDVIVCSRSADKVTATVEEIKPFGNCKGIPLDLSDLEDVQKFANNLNEEVDVLVLNAGVQTNKLEFTKQGLEITFATNHLGHMLLTELLLNKLPIKRVVVLSSGTHDPASKSGVAPPVYDLNNWANPTKHDGQVVYSSSKLANMLYGLNLAKRKPNLVVTVYDPGFIGDTGLMRTLGVFQPVAKMLINGLIYATAKFHGVENQNSTLERTIPFLAKISTSQEAPFTESGKYYSIDHPASPSTTALEVSKQEGLYEFSVNLLKSKGFSI